jgi:hypothetical protein
MMPDNQQVVGAGELENEVNTEPLDELKVSIGWKEIRPSSPLSLESFAGSRYDKFNIEIEIYLNEKGKKLVDHLAKIIEFGEDFQSVLNQIQTPLLLLGISVAFPDNKISRLLGILYISSLPFTTLKLRGRIRADPIMNFWCTSCGFREQLNPKTPEAYSKMKAERQECERWGI